MPSDLDIYRAANELIRQHGDDAPIRAAMRHDELLEAGDMDGCAAAHRGLFGYQSSIRPGAELCRAISADVGR